MIVTLGSKQYDRFSYPGGEIQVRFTEPRVLAEVRAAESVDLIARITNSQQIIELALLRNAIAGLTSCDVRLILPYLPYARADRRFTEGDCLGIGTFGQLLFAMSFSEIVTLDVHSPVAANWMMLRNVSADPFILQAINSFAKRCGSHSINVLLPDEGSKTRYNIPASTGCNTYGIYIQVFNASKKRDAETGKLSGFDVPEMPCHPTIIVDDLCDAGGTFLGIASKLSGIGDLALYTTHGLYSKGLTPLKVYFKYIYTTNSFITDYSGYNEPSLTVIDCIKELLAKEAVCV